MTINPEKPRPIAVQAIFAKATTLVDGGWRISFDLPEHEGMTVAEIAKLAGEVIRLVVVPEGASE